jgi:hypothetical protein
MKTAAILLVSGVVIYAIYEIFKGNAGLSALFTPTGQTAPLGVSVPGIPVYSSNVAAPTNFAGTVLAAATVATQAADAFGPTGNQGSGDDEFDSSDFSDSFDSDDDD